MYIYIYIYNVYIKIHIYIYQTYLFCIFIPELTATLYPFLSKVILLGQDAPIFHCTSW